MPAGDKFTAAAACSLRHSSDETVCLIFVVVKGQLNSANVVQRAAHHHRHILMK
jgi:hypothetical protein